MKFRHTLPFFLLAFAITTYAQPKKTEILILGSDHLAQIYKNGNSHTDVLFPKRQKEIKEFTALVVHYKPDMVMVEALPEKQKEIDSLYSLFLDDKLNLEDIPDGRSEIYQLAFRISRQLKLSRLYCVNAPGGTSQSILDNGENIELYKKEAMALRAIVNEKSAAIQKGNLSLKDYLIFLNQPEIFNKIYHLRYITPARVINGTFKNPDAMIDTAFINSKYIGAELTSVFKNRDYKIYSNIVTAQRSKKAEKVLLIIGVAHVGSLKSIMRDDDEFKIIDANKYLKE